MTRSWERVRGIPGREDHSPLRTEAWSSPFPPRVDDPDDERGNNPSSNATPDTKTVKARDPTKCRNGHGAHETGTARTKRARRAPIRHGAHEMALAHRSRSAVAAPHGAENWAIGGGGLVRAPSHHRSPVFAVRPNGPGGFALPARLDDRDGTERKSRGSVSGERPCVDTSSTPTPLPLP
jgi:hypothetical protein